MDQPTQKPSRLIARRRTIAALSAATLLGGLGVGLFQARHRPRRPQVTGIVWQPDDATIDPHGAWQRIGVDTLLIQWSEVDGRSLLPVQGITPFQPQPNWTRIAAEPWAQKVVLGLAGNFSESAARKEVAALARASRALAAAAQQTPLNLTGYYFPVEVDPSWGEALSLAPLLALLPRPLWISVYDRRNIGPKPFVDWLGAWLPDDINVFFQDGVGVYAREPSVAARYVEALGQRFGRARVAVIAEAFRPRFGGGFRSAEPEELRPQIAAYDGYPIFLFDGPHYVTPVLVSALQA